MKYKALYIIIFLSVIISCDKEEFFSGQEKTFIKYFGSGKPYSGVQVLASEDGGYIVLGNIESVNSRHDICLVRTDKYGNTLGAIKVYGGLYDDYAYAIKKNQSGYIIAGSTKSSISGDKDIYLVQIDNKGDTLWTSSFGNDLNDEAYDILVLDNGDLILTGYSEDPVDKWDLMIAKTSSMGILEWMFKYGYNENEVGNTIIEAGNYFIIGGSTNSRPKEFSSYNGYLVQVTKEGRIPYPVFFGSEGNSEVSSIAKTGDNTYYAACTVQSSQNEAESKINLIKFKHDYRDRIETLWTKEYGEQLFNQVSFLRAGNNSIALVGTSGSAKNKAGDLLMMKLDLEGNTPEYFYIGDGISFIGTGFDFTPDGGYIITGSNYSNENSVITLVKMN